MTLPVVHQLPLRRNIEIVSYIYSEYVHMCVLLVAIRHPSFLGLGRFLKKAMIPLYLFLEGINLLAQIQEYNVAVDQYKSCLFKSTRPMKMKQATKFFN